MRTLIPSSNSVKSLCSGKVKVEYEGSKGDDRIFGAGDGEKQSGRLASKRYRY
jgi:hypothetical protein